MAPLPPLRSGFGISAGGSKETLHQACAQAEGASSVFLAAQESAFGPSQTSDNVRCSVAIGSKAHFERPDLASRI